MGRDRYGAERWAAGRERRRICGQADLSRITDRGFQRYRAADTWGALERVRNTPRATNAGAARKIDRNRIRGPERLRRATGSESDSSIGSHHDQAYREAYQNVG